MDNNTSSNTYTPAVNYCYNCCQYRLPCGLCEKTMRNCPKSDTTATVWANQAQANDMKITLT